MKQTELTHKAFSYLMQKHNIDDTVANEIYEELFINIPIALKDFEEYETKSLTADTKMKIIIDYKYKIRTVKDEMLKEIKLNRLAKDYDVPIEVIKNTIKEWEYIHVGN